MPDIVINNRLFNNLHCNNAKRHIYNLIAFAELKGSPYHLWELEAAAKLTHSMAKELCDNPDAMNNLAVIQDVGGLLGYKAWTGRKDSDGTRACLGKKFNPNCDWSKYTRDCAKPPKDPKGEADEAYTFIRPPDRLLPKFTPWINLGVLKDRLNGTSLLSTEKYWAHRNRQQELPAVEEVKEEASEETITVPMDLFRKMVHHLASIDAKMGVIPIVAPNPIAWPSDLRIGNSSNLEHSVGSVTAG